LSAVFSVLLFSGIGEGWGFLLLFGAAYLLWDITYGINDIGYWTLLPVLSSDQKQREKIGTFARICANVGMYIVMVAWQPVTAAMGDTPRAWLICAIVIAVLYLAGLLFPLLGVREKRVAPEEQESTTVKQMLRALLKNDQLLWTTLAMGLFMVGYCTTVNFAVYYMKYLFGNEGLYVVLVAVVGVSQLGTLAVYPTVAKRMNRRALYTLGTALVVLGYLIFFVAEVSIALVVLGAVLVFVGQAFIQTLMLMFLTDTVEYGHWKLGKRNESITFSIQPLINKIGGALATGIVSMTLILSGIKIDGGTVDAIGPDGKLIVKIAMFAIPLAMIVAGYVVYLKKYTIDEKRYAQILSDLEEREKRETK
jgi:melibiose permease/lactose/raffinose/galactose permease